MPENFAYLRFDSTMVAFPKSPQIGVQEKEIYDMHNQDVRKNTQFKKIAERFNYDPSKIGYLIEKDGDQYWIRLIENQSDSGKRFAPDSGLQAILKKFYEAEDSHSDPDDPPVGSTPIRKDSPLSPFMPPTPLSPLLNDPKSTPIINSPSTPNIEPYDRAQDWSEDSTPSVGPYVPSPIRRDEGESLGFTSRAWNTLTGSAPSQNGGSSSSNPIDELYAPLRANEKDDIEEEIPLFRELNRGIDSSSFTPPKEESQKRSDPRSTSPSFSSSRRSEQDSTPSIGSWVPTPVRTVRFRENASLSARNSLTGSAPRWEIDEEEFEKRSDPRSTSRAFSSSRRSEQDSTPSIGPWVPTPVRTVRFQDVEASFSSSSRALNTSRGSNSSPRYDSLQSGEKEEILARQLSQFEAQHSSRISPPIDPNSISLPRDEYEELQRTHERLKRELAEREAISQTQVELERRAKTAEETLEQLQGQFSELEEINMRLKGTLDALEHPVQESERARRLLEEIDQFHDLEMQELTQKLKGLEQANYGLRTELGTAESEREKASILLSDQKQKMTAMADEIDQLKQQKPAPTPPQRNESINEPPLPDMSLILEKDALLDEKDEELALLREEISSSLQKLEQKDAQITDLSERLESNSRDLEGAQTDMSLADKDHKESSRKLQQQLIESAAEITILRERQISLEEELQGALEKNEHLQNESGDLRKTLAAKEKALETWALDGEDWKTKISAYKEQRDEEVAYFKSLNNTLEERLSAAVQKQKELANANAEYVERLAEPLYAIEKSKEEIASLRELLEETQHKLREAEARCEETERVYTAACSKFGEMHQKSREKEAGDAQELRRLGNEIRKLQAQIGKNEELIGRMDGVLSEKDQQLQGANETIAALQKDQRDLQNQLAKVEFRRHMLLGDLYRTVQDSPDRERENASPLSSPRILMEDLADIAPIIAFSNLTIILPETIQQKLGVLWETDRALLEAADGARLVDATGSLLSYQERGRSDAALAFIRDGEAVQVIPEGLSQTILHRLKAMSHKEADADILTSGRLSPRTNAFLENIYRSFREDPILQRLSDPEDRGNRKSLIITAHFLCNYINYDKMEELYPLASELVDLLAEGNSTNVQKWFEVKFRGGAATQHLVQDLFFLDAMYNLEGEQSKARSGAVRMRQQLLESGLLPALRQILRTA